MGKLKLNLDEIKVESFETNSTISHIGTVNGQQLPGCTDEPLNPGSCNGGGGGGGSNDFTTCEQPSWNGYNCYHTYWDQTCENYQTCNQTCQNTCECTQLFGRSECCWYSPSVLCW